MKAPPQFFYWTFPISESGARNRILWYRQTSSVICLMKLTAKRAIGTECQGCERLFSTMFKYHQHRRSPFLYGTSCHALPNENRVTVTAAPRANMSTAALERRPAQRTRGWLIKTYLKYFAFLNILGILGLSPNLRSGLTAAVRPDLRFTYFYVFDIFWKNQNIKRG